MKVTNTQPGPRGLNTTTGTVLIDPKQTVDVKVYAREKEGIEASGWFIVEGDYEPDPANGQGTVARALAGDDGASKVKIAELEKELKAKDARIAELEKLVPEADVDKMTVPELRGFLAFHDVAYDGAKDKKGDLVEKAKTVKVD